jgi:hypothetical protein
VQWEFAYQFDDGLGAAFPAVALIGLVAAAPFGRAVNERRRVVWLITVASYALWIATGSIMPRFGIFPVLLTYVFVGEIWREFESIALKAVTLAAFALSVAVITYSMVFGAVYTAATGGASGVPAVVDRLPPARIFNATSASNRYRLLGADYRHEVITMFGPPTPADIAAVEPAYVLLSSKQVSAFAAKVSMTLVDRGRVMPDGDTLSLWRVGPR